MTERQDRVAGPARRRRAVRSGLFAVLGLALFALVGLGAALALMRGTVAVPAWVLGQAVARVNAGLPPGARLDIASASVDLSEGPAAPRLVADGLVLSDAAGRPQLSLPRAEVVLSGPALARGAIEPRSVQVTGAELLIERDEQGRFSLVLIDSTAPQVASLGAALDMLERALAGPLLADFESLELSGLRVGYEDRKTGRSWRFGDGRLLLQAHGGQGGGLRAVLAMTLQHHGPGLATLALELERGAGVPTGLRLRFGSLPVADLAPLAPRFAWLAQIDANLSGSVALGLAPDGSIAALDGRLVAGPGRLPLPEALGLDGGFRALSGAFRYETARDRLELDSLEIDAPALGALISGHVFPLNGGGAEPRIVQLAVERLRLAPESVFAAPIEMESGALGLRVTPEPLRVEIGRAVLTGGGTELRLRGSLEKTGAGWNTALDADIPAISYPRLMELWPLVLKPKTRLWLERNILAAEFSGVTAALRGAPGGTLAAHMTFGFTGLEGHFMRVMPPITGGQGYGALTSDTFDLVLHEGRVAAPGAAPVSLAGSTLHVPEVALPGGPGEISLRLAGPLSGTLALLDHDPFRFISKGNVPLDIAEGQAEAEAWLRLPLRERIGLSDVDWRAEGVIREAVSETLLEGRRLTAERLDLRADPEGIAVSGAARVGLAHFEGTWDQRFGPEHAGQSEVSGQVALTRGFLDEFGIALPAEMVSGEGRARLDIELLRGESPAFRLASDLNGLRLALGGLGWLKRPDVLGRLEVRGHLARPAEIETIALEAAGLSLLGTVALDREGRFERLGLAHLRFEDWLDVAVDVVGQGPGAPPRLELRGGTLDLRRARLGEGGSDDTGDGPAPPIAVTLDRLVLTRTVALTAVSGSLSQGTGLTGVLTGRLNGGPPVELALAPAEHGAAATLTSADAGAALAAAGLLRTAEGGSLKLALVPLPEPKAYDAVLGVTDMRVRDAPLLAELLSAVSVVGLIEQMAGGGIVFSEVRAQMRLTPEALELRRASATGPSMGLSAKGWIDLAEGRMDIEGVVTPVYMINGMLEQTGLFGNLFGRRRGEGIFGFNYRMQGDAGAPQVFVNPLSVLAPGILREIFRADTSIPPGQ